MISTLGEQALRKGRLLKVMTAARVIRPYGPRTLYGIASTIKDWGIGFAGGIGALAVRAPDQVGLVDELGELTWAQIDERATRLAHGLQELGVASGDSVAVLCRNHRYFLDVSTALSKLGADILYLNTAFSAPQLGEVCDRERPAAIVYDEEFGALGYEGPHLLAIVQHLGQQYLPGDVVDLAVEDAIIPTAAGGSTLLAGQGGIDLTYLTPTGVEVNLYTSLVGRPKYVLPPLNPLGMTIAYGDPTRHRVLKVTGTDMRGDTYQIAGWYVPICGYGRSQGRLTGEWGLYADADATYDYLLRERKVTPENLVVYGQSLGTTAAPRQVASAGPVARRQPAHRSRYPRCRSRHRPARQSQARRHQRYPAGRSRRACPARGPAPPDDSGGHQSRRRPPAPAPDWGRAPGWRGEPPESLPVASRPGRAPTG